MNSQYSFQPNFFQLDQPNKYKPETVAELCLGYDDLGVKLEWLPNPNKINFSLLTTGNMQKSCTLTILFYSKGSNMSTNYVHWPQLPVSGRTYCITQTLATGGNDEPSQISLDEDYIECLIGGDFLFGWQKTMQIVQPPYLLVDVKATNVA